MKEAPPIIISSKIQTFATSDKNWELVRPVMFPALQSPVSPLKVSGELGPLKL